ncbi:hypothetical protein GVAV_002053 [Gurleya vavrai]
MTQVLIQFHNPPNPISEPLQVPISITLSHLHTLCQSNSNLFINSTQIKSDLQSAISQTNLSLESTIVITLIEDKSSSPALYNSSTFSGHGQAILAVKIHKDKVFSASGDSTVRMWDLNVRGQERIYKNSVHWINALDLLDNLMITGDMAGKLCVYMENEFVRCIDSHKKGITCLRILKEKENYFFVSAGRDGKVILWDLDGKSVFSYMHEGPVYDLIVKDDLIISCGMDGKVKIYKDKLFYKELKSHKQRVNSISLKKEIFVSCSDDNRILFYKNFEVHKEVSHKNAVSCVDISLNGLFVASCSFDKTVRIWDLHTGNCLFSYFHVAAVYKVIFRDNLVISCGKDKMIKSFCMKKGKVVSDFVCSDEVFDIDYDNGILVAGCRDGKLFFYN